jgi:outer membrane protein assembly factor BamB
MRVSTALVAAASLVVPTCQAVFLDDAWKVDWHLALVGAPQDQTTFFHQPVAASKASLLYTLSDKAILGAVNPKDGSLRWRQQLSPSSNSSSTFLRAAQDHHLVISAVDGQVAAWSAADGRQAWSVDLQDATVKDLEIVEIPEPNEQGGSKDAIVLTGGPLPTVQRLARQDGAQKWLFRDETGDVPFQLSVSSTHIFYISLHTSMLGGLKIKVVTLDPVTGHKVDQYTLATESDLGSTADILSVGANSASPIIAWTDKAHSTLKVNVIGSKGVSTFNIDADQKVNNISLHAPYHVNARPHFLVHYETSAQNWADVYHVDLVKSTVSKAYSLPKLKGNAAFSASTSEANVYFTRISESEVTVVSSASHGVLTRWPLKGAAGITLQGDHAPIHAVSEVSVKADTVSAVRSAVYLASGEWVLIRDGTPVWERPEALSSIKSAVWAYSAAPEGLVHELEIEGHSNPVQAYIHRVTRHVAALKSLPVYLAALPGRLAGSVGLGKSDADVDATNTFGFHKRIVCATESGRLIALDAAGNGNTIWNVKIADNVASSSWSSPKLDARPDGTIVASSVDETQHRLFNASTGAELTYTGSALSSGLGSGAKYAYGVEDGKVVGGPIAEASSWKFSPGNGERVYSLTPRPLDDPVASIGKVLGDRKVLYKYLNPNTLLVITASEVTLSATVSVLDALSGSVLYTASHQGVDATLPIASTMSENWFAYSFTSQPTANEVKGYQLIVGEMFESPFSNDRGPQSAIKNSTEVDYSYQPHVVSQSYRIREPISKLAVTQTRQGITSRALLAVMPESNAIVAIPRHVIDPRRPVGREANKDEMMEGLMKYTPVLEFDPKWYLNHQREIYGVETITTSPAVLESTSLVFAYGLDVFSTRISPSFSFDILGKDFNKVQMLATVAALAVATVAVAPLVSLLVNGSILNYTNSMFQVKRKEINTRWRFL